MIARQRLVGALSSAMLRSLVGGGQPQDGSTQGKLLELADQDTEQPTPSSQGGGLQQDEDEEMADAAQEQAMASVITQVSALDQQRAAQPAAAAAVQYAEAGGEEGGEGSEVRSTWKNKFR